MHRPCSSCLKELEPFQFTIKHLHHYAIKISLLPIKSGNLKWHCKTTHKDFHKKFPLENVTHKYKLNACMLSYKNSTTTLVRCKSEQEKSIEVTLCVCAGLLTSIKSNFHTPSRNCKWSQHFSLKPSFLPFKTFLFRWEEQKF